MFLKFSFFNLRLFSCPFFLSSSPSKDTLDRKKSQQSSRSCLQHWQVRDWASQTWRHSWRTGSGFWWPGKVAGAQLFAVSYIGIGSSRNGAAPCVGTSQEPRATSTYRLHSRQNSYSLIEAILPFHCASLSSLPFHYLAVVQDFFFYPDQKRKIYFCVYSPSFSKHLCRIA